MPQDHRPEEDNTKPATGHCRAFYSGCFFVNTKEKIRYWWRSLARVFMAHPQEAGESYLAHLGFTLYMAARFAWIALAIVIHGVFPFLFITTASRQVAEISHIMRERSQKSAPPASDA